MKVIVKTTEGREFMYNPRTARGVNPRKVWYVLDVLNKHRWNLAPGEIWYAYDVDDYDMAHDVAQFQKFTCSRDGIVKAVGRF